MFYTTLNIIKNPTLIDSCLPATLNAKHSKMWTVIKRTDQNELPRNAASRQDVQLSPVAIIQKILNQMSSDMRKQTNLSLASTIGTRRLDSNFI